MIRKFCAFALVSTLVLSANGLYAATLPGTIGDDKPTLEYNPATGGLTLHAEGTSMNTYVLKSASGIFEGFATASLINPGGFFKTTTLNELSENFFTPTLAAGASHSLGNIAKTGLTPDFLYQDLTLDGGLSGSANFAIDLFPGIPEPTSIAMAGIGLISMVGVARRRRA